MITDNYPKLNKTSMSTHARTSTKSFTLIATLSDNSFNCVLIVNAILDLNATSAETITVLSGLSLSCLSILSFITVSVEVSVSVVVSVVVVVVVSVSVSVSVEK